MIYIIINNNHYGRTRTAGETLQCRRRATTVSQRPVDDFLENINSCRRAFRNNNFSVLHCLLHLCIYAFITFIYV